MIFKQVIPDIACLLKFNNCKTIPYSAGILSSTDGSFSSAHFHFPLVDCGWMFQIMKVVLTSYGTYYFIAVIG